MIPRNHVVICLCILALTAGASAYFYPQLPDPSAVHWNLRGEADGYGRPWILAAIMPAGAAGLLALLAILPLVGPFRRNFESFRDTYGKICVLVMTLFLLIHVVTLLKAVGHTFSIGSVMAIVVGGMFVVLGNWMGKIRRNFYVGIRTPWTIANDAVWEKTHRVGGPIMVAVGIASILSGLFAPEWVSFAVLVGGAIGLTVWAVAYSLYWYRRLGGIDELPPSPVGR